MPLQPYLRGATWWAKGRIEYLGRPISEYYRQSTGAASRQGALEWIAAKEERAIRRHLVGDEAALTFAEAVLLYPADATTAAYLIPIVERWGDTPLAQITPLMVRQLAPELYPETGTATWTRQVVTPVRAVINHAHDLGKAAPIRIRGFSKEERAGQDSLRGSTGRRRYPPGSWEWLLCFRSVANERLGALALTMFVTGARISQACAMHPGKHLRLQEGKLCVPGAKGHGDRWLDIPPEMVADLANLPPLYPRGFERKPANLRVFGWSSRSGPRKAWANACRKAKIEFLPFHSAGRHGFGQEMNVRQPIDEKAAGAFGGWSDTALMRRTYTHGEDVAAKVHESFYRGLRAAEQETGLKLGRAVG
ncbi:site-specific integrase [Erythrobacter rubeus]|uniref:Tyrosine-type recombinase/integrase n=1 Tax=Erythrobacter rubeus TaxID=2760803 RepID=A0ABR8KW69_9SPHN|nr:tyrosine-type recombinase/integrase [Erythrobacter rubeus]MBD2842674.1 tyrosine-type recombinase/integrase [Erythrobacter rubeus]